MSENKKAEDQYLELYRLAVESADRVSDRRASFLSLPLTANTALFAVLFGGNFSGSIWIVAIVGLTISVLWWVLTKAYRDLNTAKYEVIMELEKHLEVQLINKEWQIVQERALKGNFLARFTQLYYVERALPPIFAALYLIVLIQSLL